MDHHILEIGDESAAPVIPLAAGPERSQRTPEPDQDIRQLFSTFSSSQLSAPIQPKASNRPSRQIPAPYIGSSDSVTSTEPLIPVLVNADKVSVNDRPGAADAALLTGPSVPNPASKPTPVRKEKSFAGPHRNPDRPHAGQEQFANMGGESGKRPAR
ncbi:hypothetical protein DL770_011209 [Monosporascus sp. CRB-9-2]|nr:hypothetical protein DL770_011209 [Monosporascus sp. CRB-9-2]